MEVPKMSIVIPCYNEVKNIPLVLECFRHTLNRKDVELVLVDNGSTDGTATVLKDLLPKYSFAQSIRVEVNQGYGYGIVQGLNICKGKFIGWTHADMQTNPADVMKALEIIENNNDDERIFVKGNRKGRSVFDMFFTYGMSVFDTLYLGERLYDINAQPNVFSRKFYDTWKNPPKDFALDLYALYTARKSHLDIRRFDVFFPKRLHGKSHWNNGTLKSKLQFIKRTLNASRQLKHEASRK